MTNVTFCEMITAWMAAITPQRDAAFHTEKRAGK